MRSPRRPPIPLYIGQQMDVYIEAAKPPGGVVLDVDPTTVKRPFEDEPARPHGQSQPRLRRTFPDGPPLVLSRRCRPTPYSTPDGRVAEPALSVARRRRSRGVGTPGCWNPATGDPAGNPSGTLPGNIEGNRTNGPFRLLPGGGIVDLPVESLVGGGVGARRRVAPAAPAGSSGVGRVRSGRRSAAAD